MSKPSKKRAPKPLIAASFTLAVLTGLGAWAVLPLMAQPIVRGAPPPFFIGVDSAQNGGSLWTTVGTSKPVNLATSDNVELTITIASDKTSANPYLVFGGQAATALTACEGTGMFVDTTSPTTAFVRLPSRAKALVLDYEQHTPRTGELDNWVGYDTNSVEGATDEAKQVSYRTAEVKLAVPGTRLWAYPNEADQTYKVNTATITCAFRESAFLRSNSYAQTFSVPDLFAGVADLASKGPVRIDYKYELINNAGEVSTFLSFPTENQSVDKQTGNRLVTYSGNWWERLTDGRQGVLISTGTARFEPEQAANWRILARLLAGFLASSSIALFFIAVRKTLYYWM